MEDQEAKEPDDRANVWRPTEDERLLQLVREYGVKKWTIVAEQLKKQLPDSGHSAKQCRERWRNHVDPRLNKNPWSGEEELAFC